MRLDAASRVAALPHRDHAGGRPGKDAVVAVEAAERDDLVLGICGRADNAATRRPRALANGAPEADAPAGGRDREVVRPLVRPRRGQDRKGGRARAEEERPVRPPAVHRDGVARVEADGEQQVAAPVEGELPDAVAVASAEHREGRAVRSTRAPHDNSRVCHAGLASGDEIACCVYGERRHASAMLEAEGLHKIVALLAIHLVLAGLAVLAVLASHAAVTDAHAACRVHEGAGAGAGHVARGAARDVRAEAKDVLKNRRRVRSRRPLRRFSGTGAAAALGVLGVLVLLVLVLVLVVVRLGRRRHRPQRVQLPGPGKRGRRRVQRGRSLGGGRGGPRGERRGLPCDAGDGEHRRRVRGARRVRARDAVKVGDPAAHARRREAEGRELVLRQAPGVRRPADAAEGSAAEDLDLP